MTCNLEGTRKIKSNKLKKKMKFDDQDGAKTFERL
jgi:hypothetical protein